MTPISLVEAKAAELKRYFTSAPCPQGHVSERYVSTRACCACTAEKAAARPAEVKRAIARRGWAKDPVRSRLLDKIRRDANPEHHREESRRSHRRTREKHLAERAAWREANPEAVMAIKAVHTLAIAARKAKRTAFVKQWNEANRDKVNAKAARYRKTHPERIAAYDKMAFAKNPEKKRALNHNRRARLVGCEGTHTGADVLLLFKKQRGRCAYYSHCKTTIKSGSYHKDHITALSKGGSNRISNIQLLCIPCNTRKNAKDPISFAQEIGFLL